MFMKMYINNMRLQQLSIEENKQNKINKNIANNKKISYSESDNEKENKIDSGKVNISSSQKNINQKINDIFMLRLKYSLASAF